MGGTGTPVPMEATVTTSDRSTALGQQLRTRRRSLDLTQEQLADLAGCSIRFIRALEAGKPSVRLDKVLDVLDVLGLDLQLAPTPAP